MNRKHGFGSMSTRNLSDINADLIHKGVFFASTKKNDKLQNFGPGYYSPSSDSTNSNWNKKCQFHICQNHLKF